MTVWRRLGAWLFRDPSTGRIVIGQAPNAAISVWAVATLCRVADALPAHDEQLAGIARGALIVWGVDELVRGANPFRRMLGAAVLGWQLSQLLLG